MNVSWTGKFTAPDGKPQTHKLVFTGADLAEVHDQIRGHVQGMCDQGYELIYNEITKIEK